MTSTTLDTETMADGSQLIDMDASGSQDIVVGTDLEGGAVWYENDAGWTQHQIASGYESVEGVDAVDIDGDGDVEVFILDQPGGVLDIAVQDNSDPTGSWSTTTLDGNATNVVNTLLGDLAGDGDKNDLIYSYEGGESGDGGVYWLEWTGGDVGSASNWDKHEIVQEEGAWGLSRRFADLSGDGTTLDIAFTARTARNDAAGGGVWWLEKPSDPRDLWTQHEIDTEDSALQVDIGDLSGNGDAKDVVVGRFDDGEGVYWYDEANSWERNAVTTGSTWYNVRAKDYTENAAWDIITVEQSPTELAFWKKSGDAYQPAAVEDLYKEVERIPFGDIDGDGSDEFVTVSEEKFVEYWDVEIEQS